MTKEIDCDRVTPSNSAWVLSKACLTQNFVAPDTIVDQGSCHGS